MNKLRIGILGAGRIASIAILNPARDQQDVDVTCIAARDTSRARALADRYGVASVARDYAELLTRDDIDLVHVALPAGLHAEWTIRALNAGKAVLCEKPFAMSSDEARQMVQASERSKRPLLEAFHYRHHSVLRRLFDIVASGDLGKLTRAYAVFETPIAVTPTEFRWSNRLGGGALMDLGSYCVHVLRTIACSEPKVISAASEIRQGVDATTQATLEFVGGLTADINCSMIPDRFQSRLWLEGDRGSLEITNFVAPQLGCAFSVAINGNERHEPVDGPSSFAAQLKHVSDVILRAAAPLTGGKDSIAMMASVEAIRNCAEHHAT